MSQGWVGRERYQTEENWWTGWLMVVCVERGNVVVWIDRAAFFYAKLPYGESIDIEKSKAKRTTTGTGTWARILLFFAIRRKLPVVQKRTRRDITSHPAPHCMC